MTEDSEICANIVLAGDPHQLQAVTKCQQAKELGYSESFMEYLMSKTLYKPEYNPRFITCLTKNYRSHHSIIAVPNKLFYDNRLEAFASAGTIYLYIYLLFTYSLYHIPY